MNKIETYILHFASLFLLKKAIFFLFALMLANAQAHTSELQLNDPHNKSDKR